MIKEIKDTRSYDERALCDMKILRDRLNDIIIDVEENKQKYYPVTIRISLVNLVLDIYKNLVLARGTD